MFLRSSLSLLIAFTLHQANSAPAFAAPEKGKPAAIADKKTETRAEKENPLKPADQLAEGLKRAEKSAKAAEEKKPFKDAGILKKAFDALGKKKFGQVRTLVTPLRKNSIYSDYAQFLIGSAYQKEAAAQLERKKYSVAAEMARKSVTAFFEIEPAEPYSPLLRKLPEQIAASEVLAADANVLQKKFKLSLPYYERAFQRLNSINSLYLLTPSSLENYALSCSKSKSAELCDPWTQRLVQQFPKNSEELKALARHMAGVQERSRPNYATKLTLSYKSKDADQTAFDEAMKVYLEDSAGSAIKAFQLYTDTYPRSTYRYRARFWLARSYLKDDQPELAKKLLEEIVKESPLTYYGLLASLELKAPLSQRFATEVPLANSSDPFQTPLETVRLKRAERLVNAKLGEFATLDLRDLRPRDSATNEFLLYLATLNSEAGNYISSFSILSELIARGHEGVYSQHGLNLVFPIVQQELIKKNAAAVELDPVLVLSLMKQESAFDALVHSSSGASGLMQLMPLTAVDTEATVKRSDLLDPDTNIRVGAKYLKKMLIRFDGNIAMALGAYNAGPGAMGRWVREGKAKHGLLEFVEQIPYKETREYVGSIMRNYFWYSQRIKGETLTDLNQFWVAPKDSGANPTVAFSPEPTPEPAATPEN